jgi:Tol biopolymer transport system component
MALVVTDIVFVDTTSSGKQGKVGGNLGTYGSVYPAFSLDGTQIAFESDFSDLVPNDTNGISDLFVKNLTTGVLTRVSTDSSGNQATGPNYPLYQQVFSPDGTKIAFRSTAPNLVAGDTNGQMDIFLKNLVTGETTRVSTDSVGGQLVDPATDAVFSPNGTQVAFRGGNGIYIKDLLTGELKAVTSGGGGHYPAFSPDGTKLAFSGNSGYLSVMDLTTGASQVTAWDGEYPVFSPDGTKISFISSYDNLVPEDTNDVADTFVMDLSTGAITLVSQTVAGVIGNKISGLTQPSFSPDGTMIAFASSAYNFFPGEAHGQVDIFVKNLVTGELSGIPPEDPSVKHPGVFNPVFSPDGTRIAFDTHYAGFVSNDKNGMSDIYVATLNTTPVILGTNGDDYLKGTAGDDYIYGLEGNDRLDGKGGNDTLIGGNGDDSYVVGNAGVRIIEAVGGGTDKVYASLDYALGVNVENLTLQGTGAISGTGNDLVNVINGNDAANVIAGLGGDDRLYGRGGNDTILGGADVDSLYGGADADTFVFDSTAFTGRDTIKDFSLADGDKIELQGLLTGYTPGVSAVTDFVHIIQSAAGNSYLYVDATGAPGWANFVQIARLDSVTGLTDEAALLASGNLVIS